MMATQPPAGIFPISAQFGPWHGAPPMPVGWQEATPVSWREAMPAPGADPADLLRGVTGAVMAVSTAMRQINAAMAHDGLHDAAVMRAMAALDAAVAQQAVLARAVLARLARPTVPATHLA